MMKQIIPYTLLAVCLLSACQTDDYEPAAGTSGESEMLSLTVSANDFAVTGKTSTRAADNGKTTTFENGDRVGLIVLDAADGIIADNLPYKFDGSSWNFDTGNGEGKQPVFYNPSMNTYIVYYPYDATADQTASVDALKALAAFAHQADQSTEDAYRQSDLMVWSSSGTPMKQINAELTHTHNSFSLDTKAQCTLATGDVLSYTPPALEDVIIYDKEGKQLSPYRAEDGSFRYVLPDGYEGSLRCTTLIKKIPMAENAPYLPKPKERAMRRLRQSIRANIRLTKRHRATSIAARRQMKAIRVMSFRRKLFPFWTSTGASASFSTPGNMNPIMPITLKAVSDKRSVTVMS